MVYPGLADMPYSCVSSPQGHLYVQKRVAFKETFPSHYDPAPGGVVGVSPYQIDWSRGRNAATCMFLAWIPEGICPARPM